METAAAIVYRARNLVNGKSYIGFTAKGLARRERGHRETANAGGGHLLQAAMRKYGHENIVFEVMFDFEGDEDLARVYEIEAIAKYKPEYNLSYGGDGGRLAETSRKKIGDANRGKKHTAETLERMSVVKRGKVQLPSTREKIRLANLGRSPGTKGKPVSEETRRKLSLANKGRAPWTAGKNHSEETRRKMSAWQVGRKLSEETRARISEARKKLVPTEAMRAGWKKSGLAMTEAKKLPVKCLEDGRVFAGSSDADRFYGWRVGLVSRIVKGTVKNKTGRTFVRHIPEGE